MILLHSTVTLGDVLQNEFFVTFAVLDVLSWWMSFLKGVVN